MKKITLLRKMTEKQAEPLKGTFLTEGSFDTLITEDVDAYDSHGNMVLKFRKNVIPFETLKLGYKSFEKSIEKTEGRGSAAGKPFKRVRKDGSVSNTTVSNFVESGSVGFMDENAMVKYCRKTAFARNYFKEFTEGIPFVKAIDKLYSQLCPEHYKRQINIARGTNRNYVIGDTSFTTVTVNRNFQTAVHKDSGDLPDGFGNLCVYREGHYDGAYFCLPEYRVAVDMQNCDMLFVDVHRWHANTPFVNCSPDFLRIAFVMYYREQMINCSQPKDELFKTKMDRGGFLKL